MFFFASKTPNYRIEQTSSRESEKATDQKIGCHHAQADGKSFISSEAKRKKGKREKKDSMK